MSIQAPSERPGKLPVWRAIAWSFKSVFANLGYLLRISWAWLVIMIPLLTGAQLYLNIAEKEGTLSSAGNFSLDMLRTTFLTLPYFASISLAWLRFLLTGERVASPAYLRLDWSVVRLLPICLVGSAYGLAFAAVSQLPWQFLGFWLTAAFNRGMPVFVLTFVVVMSALTIFPVMISTRLMLAVPQLAAELPAREGALARVWQATQGSSWRIALGMLTVAVIPIVFWNVPYIVIGDSAVLSWADPMLLAKYGISAIGELVVSWFTLAYVAFCARHFRLIGDAETPPSPRHGGADTVSGQEGPTPLPVPVPVPAPARSG